MRRTSKRRPHVPMDAHIRIGNRYIYNPVQGQEQHHWLKQGDEVICKQTLPDLPMHCEVESLDQKYNGKVHILSLRLAGDLGRK